MLDGNALALVQDTAVLAARIGNEGLPEHVVALPSSVAVHDLEKYLPNRTRFRGVYKTTVIAEFVAYVLAAAASLEPGERVPAVFVDAEKYTATGFFNLWEGGEPGHADHRAVLALQKTAAYKAVQAINGTKLTQRELLDFIEDWQTLLRGVTDDQDQPMSVPVLVGAIRKLKIKTAQTSDHVDNGLRASRSTFEEAAAETEGQTPSLIPLVCAPFLGLAERIFAFRVGVLTSHGEPKFVLRLVGAEKHEEEIAEEFKTVLQDGVGDQAALAIGTFTP